MISLILTNVSHGGVPTSSGIHRKLVGKTSQPTERRNQHRDISNTNLTLGASPQDAALFFPKNRGGVVGRRAQITINILIDIANNIMFLINIIMIHIAYR